MNNTFDIKRFGLVLRKDFIENGKRYMLLFLTMFGLMALVITFQTWGYYSNKTLVNTHADNHYIIHNINLLVNLSFMFFASGIWFASTFSNPMNRKLKRLSYLISPSSNFEKFLVRWMITTIGFIVAFFVAMWMADLIRVAICSVIFSDMDIHFLDITKLVALKDHTYTSAYLGAKDEFMMMVSFYFFLQSIFLLGSTFWEKATFIKTFTAGTALLVTYILLCRWVILLCYGSLRGYENVMGSFEFDNYFTENRILAFSIVFFAVCSVTCWILAFFRIKESEITKRL